MLFPTVTFAIFFTLTFSAAWALQKAQEKRKTLLLGASYFFYGWWDWRFCFLLLGASLIAWLAGLGLKKTNSTKVRKQIIMVAITLLMIVLGFFKYYGFFLSSLQDLLFSVGLERDLPFLQIVLPVGISFFTFQAISYVIDVYRNQIEACRKPLDVLLYISFFPQLVAGPIVRAADFLPQLTKPAVLTKSMVSSGLLLCAIGLFKKMVVANYLASDLVDPVFLDPSSHSSIVVLLGVYAYAVQIYCDFSGYSDIAIGTALLLGFRFKKNFDQPYRATSLQDFWRRWHMSLSQWLRDYLYIPLGGSRFGTWKTYRNLFLTMFLGGLWHGAAWNFIIWGSLHGAWLAVERALGWPANLSGLQKFFGWFLTFHLVCAAWVFFRAADLDASVAIFESLAAGTFSAGELTWLALALTIGTLLTQFSPSNGIERLTQALEKQSIFLVGCIFMIALLVIIWVSPSGTAPFIYFQF